MAKVMTEGMLSSNTDEWGTPQYLYDVLDAEFGFEVDVCANEKKITSARPISQKK